MAQDSNTIIPGLTPAVRAWIYGVIIAAVPLLTAYGVLDDSKAAVWVAAAAAVLGLGTSAAHVKAAPEVVETAAVDEDALAERVADQVVASQAPTRVLHAPGCHRRGGRGPGDRDRPADRLSSRRRPPSSRVGGWGPFSASRSGRLVTRGPGAFVEARSFSDSTHLVGPLASPLRGRGLR